MEITSEYQEYPKIDKKMIVYSDGGCRGDNRFTGWGCFSEVKVTDEKSDLCRIQSYGGITAPSTNQVAELVGATKAIQLANKHGVEDLLIKTDSQYVIEGITKHYNNWVKNGYLNSQGKPIANKPYWDKLAKENTDFKASGGKIKYQWVKGHSGNVGNEWADKLATLGVGLSSKSDKEVEVTKYIRVTKSVEAVTKPKYKFSYNRMHVNDFVYFRVGEEPTPCKDGYYTYYTGKMQGLDELGVLAAENKLAVIKIKEPLPLINEVTTVHSQMDKDSCGYIGQIITRHLYQAKVAEAVDLDGIHMLTRVGLCYSHVKEKPSKKGPYRGKGNWLEKDDLYFEDKCITYIANPPRNSFKLIDQLTELEFILNKCMKDNFASSKMIDVFDITDEIFVVEEKELKNKRIKKTIKVNPDLAPPATTYTHHPVIDGKKYKVKMRLGLDFLARNDFSGMLKGKTDAPTVKMVYMRRGATANWFTIVESDGDWGIYAAQCSNMIVL